MRFDNKPKDLIIPNSCYGSGSYYGFFKIWKSDPSTGIAQLVVEKRNTIVYQGADLLAMALAGQPNAGISHMYLQYSTVSPGTLTIDKSDNVVDDFTSSATVGFFRVPLAFPASFAASDTSYSKNVVVFTTVLNSTSGLLLPNSPTANGSYLYSAGLVAATNPAETPTSHPNDKLFARISFTALQYDQSQSLTISWGVKFSA